jgi:hypothetical protein
LSELDITPFEIPFNDITFVSGCDDNMSTTILALFMIEYLLEFDISIVSILEKVVFTQELPLLRR